MLRAKERTLIPSFIIFILEFTFESFKEFGGVSIVDRTNMYFIFIFHFGEYPFSNFQTRINHKICIKVKNTS